MGKKAQKEKGRKTKNRNGKQSAGEKQGRALDQFLAATLEELVIAINELPDGIILEVYFD